MTLMVWDNIVSNIFSKNNASGMHIEILRSFGVIANCEAAEGGFNYSRGVRRGG